MTDFRIVRVVHFFCFLDEGFGEDLGAGGVFLLVHYVA